MGAQDTLIRHLESQGATVKKIKKGIMIYGPPPTKGTFTIHNTPSDHRSLANDMAALRRIGLTHPLDKKPLTMVAGEGYGAHILAPVTPRVMKQAREEMFSRGWPLEATTSMLTGYMAGMTAEKALYQLGYRHHPEGKRKGPAKIWVADEEITRLHEEVKAHPLPADKFDSGPVPDVEVKLREPGCKHESWEAFPSGGRKCTDCSAWLQPLLHCTICDSDTHSDIGHPFVDDHQGEDGPYQNPGKTIGETADPAWVGENVAPHVDFIDERDSWVVDLEELFGPHILRMMNEKLAVLHAVGMEYEMRVWRKPTEGES